jgi:hypothetical protein
MNPLTILETDAGMFFCNGEFTLIKLRGQFTREIVSMAPRGSKPTQITYQWLINMAKNYALVKAAQAQKIVFLI